MSQYGTLTPNPLDAVTASPLPRPPARLLAARSRRRLDHVEKWCILDGPTEQTVDVHDDFEVWIATLQRMGDPKQTRSIRVEISRSVRHSAPHLTAIQTALRTNGRTAIERYLSEQYPPARLYVGETAILSSDY
jgi:hypothetical protein